MSRWVLAKEAAPGADGYDRYSWSSVVVRMRKEADGDGAAAASGAGGTGDVVDAAASASSSAANPTLHLVPLHSGLDWDDLRWDEHGVTITTHDDDEDASDNINNNSGRCGRNRCNHHYYRLVGIMAVPAA
jgi:hypothetical protein